MFAFLDIFSFFFCSYLSTFHQQVNFQTAFDLTAQAVSNLVSSANVERFFAQHDMKYVLMQMYV